MLNLPNPINNAFPPGIFFLPFPKIKTDFRFETGILGIIRTEYFCNAILKFVASGLSSVHEPVCLWLISYLTCNTRSINRRQKVAGKV